MLKIEAKIQKLPRSVLEELLRHSDNLLFESKTFLQEQLDKTKIRPAGFKVVHNIATRKFRASV
ncbi:hypothetical protein PS002_23445, partial [Shigella sonnei]|nr:hypothetical protein [Shigella sonnei]